MFNKIRTLFLTQKPIQIFLLLLSLLTITANQFFVTPQDFCPNYYAARNFANHESIYKKVPCGNLSYNAYPPITSLIFLPFSRFPFMYATFLWGLCIVGCYVAICVILLSQAQKLSILSLSTVLFVSSIWPLSEGLSWYKNLAPVVFFLIISAWILRKRQHDYLAGILLGIASLFKIWPILLIGGLLITRHVKIFISASLTVLFGILGSLLIFPWKDYVTYVGPIRVYEETWLTSQKNISIIGLLMKLFHGYPPLILPVLKVIPTAMIITIGIVVSLTLILITAFSLFRFSKERPELDMLHEGIIVTLCLLVFPLMWDWNCMILLLPYTILFLQRRKLSKQPFWLYFLLGCGLFPFLDPNFLIKNVTIFSLFFYFVTTVSILLFLIGQIVLVNRICKERTNFALEIESPNDGRQIL